MPCPASTGNPSCRNSFSIATQITILQTTISVISFGGAIVAFIGWKEIKNVVSKTAKEGAKKYFLYIAPEQKPTDDGMKQSKKQKDDIENIKIEKE